MRYFCSLHYRNNKIPLFKLGISPNDLKLVELTPLYKKKDLLNKEKYHPVSGLSYFPEIFEKIVYKQIKSYMEPRFSHLLCGFRKNHNTQPLLSKMFEQLKLILDKGCNIVATFMDLSKALDTHNHEIFLAALNAYGLPENVMAYIKSYFFNRYQNVQNK